MSDPTRPLTGKVAVVTGASRSIGAAIAERLGGSGARVAVHYRSRKDEAEAVVAGILSKGGEAVAVAGDLADPAAVTELFVSVRERLGAIAIVVANAGVPSPLAPVAAITDDQVAAVLRDNTSRPSMCCGRPPVRSSTAGGS